MCAKPCGMRVWRGYRQAFNKVIHRNSESLFPLQGVKPCAVTPSTQGSCKLGRTAICCHARWARPPPPYLPPLLPQRFPAPPCCHVFFYLLVEPPAPTCFPGALAVRGGVLCGQWHAGHGSGLADGGADRFFLPGSAGADGRVSAHVFAGPARRRVGRHQRPQTPHLRGADRPNRRFCAADAAGAAGLGRPRHGAAAGVCGRMLHGHADARVEFLGDRPGAPR